MELREKREKKTKIIIWGISSPIWQAVSNSINLYNTEIVAFIDSDINKQGILFHGIPIVSVDEIDYLKIDYIVITAYSGFQSIVNTLKDKKIPYEKIQLFLSPDITDYYLGDISQLEWDKSLELYYEPQKLKRSMLEYLDNYAKYSKISPKIINKTDWFYKKYLIAHALGGYVNNVPIKYTNSRESILSSIKNGFSLVECDVIRMPNEKWYCGHDYSCLYSSKETGFNTLSLDELLLIVDKHLEVNCLFDVKWEEVDDYALFVSELNKIIRKMPNYARLKKQIILEVYNEETICIAYENGYQMIYTQYRNLERKNYMKSAIICDKYDISVLAESIVMILNSQSRKLPIWTEKGLNFFVFSTDSPDEFAQIKKLGGYGAFTNWLMPRTIRN